MGYAGALSERLGGLLAGVPEDRLRGFCRLPGGVPAGVNQAQQFPPDATLPTDGKSQAHESTDAPLSAEDGRDESMEILTDEELIDLLQ